MVGLWNTWIITEKMHEENYDQKISKKKLEISQKISKCHILWIPFFTLKRLFKRTYW